MTRTYKRLYPRIYDWETLYTAWKKASRGGKRKWPTVAAFEIDLEDNLWALHEERAQVFPVRAGIPWLGFRVFPTHRRLLRHNVKAFKRRFRAQRDAYRAGRISADEIKRSLQAWIAHASHADTYRLRQAILKEVVF